MKQSIAAVLAVLLLVFCAGCGREASAPPALSADASAPAAQAEPAAAEPEADATEPPAPAPEPTPEPEPTPAPYDFAWPVPESAAVDPSWFSDAAFIGDSIMVSLHWYCVNTDQLPGVEWLCSGSLSARNALWEISDESVHPEYNGVKTKLEDAVADCGAKNVYIMLGTNNISFGIDEATADMVTMIENILAQSPDVNILIMSVPPMTRTSTIWYDALNNDRINEYNEAMRKICIERQWYFIDCGPMFRDADGNLANEYCSDPYDMGIHFTDAASQLWIDYLLTHVPEPLK